MKLAFRSFTVAAAVALVGCTLAVAQEAKKERKRYDAPPEMKIDPNKKYSATIDTDKGKVVVELFAKEAPKTVNNFVFLAREGFYDGIIFHRVIPDFMVQTGDPTGTGRGGPGYRFEDEVDPEKNPRKFQPGTLAMANAGPNTNGSQFFINEKGTPWLQGRHTVFGQVTEGQDVVHAIASADRDDNDRPKQQITIKSITIKEE
ncbi:MAG TPA: peptidylprolyl isomerase [Tepidisphaeraceae bacterium]|nr:peptidylprolyl isomerase [Tepidisphaeraceae bacterium]